MTTPTVLDRYHTAYHQWNALDFEIRQLAKRRKPAPADLLVQREAAWNAYQAALAELNRIVSGRK